MKKRILGITFYMTGLLFFAQPSIAQYVPPSLSDNFWYSCVDASCAPEGYISGINTAMIDYVAGVTGYGQFIVSDYCGNGIGGGIAFEDYISGSTVSLPYLCATPNIMQGKVDIAVGNDVANPLNAFIIAASYQNGATGTGQVDFYQAYFPSGMPGGFVVNFLGSTIVNGTNLSVDAIAEKSNTIPTGLPLVENIALTWQNGADVFVEEINLHSFPAAATGIPIIQGLSCDVAGIQRKTITVDDLALITYTDYSAGTLFEADYDMTISTIVSSTMLATLAPGSLTDVRMDAIDDWMVNTPSPTLAYFRTVYHDASLGGDWLVDNTCAMAPVNDVSYIVPTPVCDFYAPSIAFGGDFYSQYQTVHYQDEYSCAAGANPKIYMEPTSRNAPLIPPTVPGISCGSPFYYGVNYTSISSIGTSGGDYNLAVSTPANKPDDATLVAWSLFVPSLGVSQVYFKVSTFTCSGGSNGYQFREAGTAGTTPPTGNKWTVFPNPAQTSITVDATGVDTYLITDMPGRTILQGQLGSGIQDIDVSSLAPGSYIIASYHGTQLSNHATFVKL